MFFFLAREGGGESSPSFGPRGGRFLFDSIDGAARPTDPVKKTLAKRNRRRLDPKLGPDPPRPSPKAG
jgi:hypothetical protein